MTFKELSKLYSKALEEQLYNENIFDYTKTLEDILRKHSLISNDMHLRQERIVKSILIILVLEGSPYERRLFRVTREDPATSLPVILTSANLFEAAQPNEDIGEFMANAEQNLYALQLHRVIEQDKINNSLAYIEEQFGISEADIEEMIDPTDVLPFAHELRRMLIKKYGEDTYNKLSSYLVQGFEGDINYASHNIKYFITSIRHIKRTEVNQ